MLFEGQLEDPSAPGHRLYPTRFCRECGYEVHVITKTEDAEGILFLPRGIDDTPLDDQEGETAGYLTPTGDGDPEYIFTGEIETYPEDWREERNGVERRNPTLQRGTMATQGDGGLRHVRSSARRPRSQISNTSVDATKVNGERLR